MDNTPYIIADNLYDDFKKSLEETSTVLFQWFDNNFLKSNPDRCHVLISSNKNVTGHVGEYVVVIIIIIITIIIIIIIIICYY